MLPDPNCTPHEGNSFFDWRQAEARCEISRIDRFLAIKENNRRSSSFIPEDAMMALDMAGFVLGKLGVSHGAPISAARLALGLLVHSSRRVAA